MLGKCDICGKPAMHVWRSAKVVATVVLDHPVTMPDGETIPAGESVPLKQPGVFVRRCDNHRWAAEE